MKLIEEKIDGEIVFKGTLLEVHKDKILCPNNEISYREYINKGKAAAIMAKTKDNKFILEKQFRYPFHDTIIEFPAGKTEKDEDTKITAIRELEEETGYKASNVIYLGTTFPSVAYTSEAIDLYYCEATSKGETHLDQNEFVEVFYKSEEEIKEMIKSGEIKDSKTAHLFCLYLLNKDKIK